MTVSADVDGAKGAIVSRLPMAVLVPVLVPAWVRMLARMLAPVRVFARLCCGMKAPCNSWYSARRGRD